MSRDLDPTQDTELEQGLIRPAWIIRLDIKDDPVQVWTGVGQLIVSGSGDTALDGFTFEGISDIGEIGAIKDTERGSGALKLKLPAVDIDKILLDQIINVPRIWQFRNAYIWFALLDTANNIIINPFRVKTGRLDSISLTDDGSKGTAETTIESHQAYISRALGASYSEQKEIDATDTSQDFVHDLANKTPGISANTSGGGAGSSGAPSVVSGGSLRGAGGGGRLIEDIHRL